MRARLANGRAWPKMLAMSFHFLRIALPLTLVTVACSSNSSSPTPSNGPTITSIQVPSTFTVSGTQYSVTGTMTYQDNSAVITTLHEKIPMYDLDTTDAATLPESGTASVLLGFVTSAAPASGTQVVIDVSLIDANGTESNVESVTVSVP
jgi:hypothetical protein